jgi:hypothetical protein
VCGWWEGVFAKASGGARKNDTFIKLSLLGIGIKFSARVLVQIFRTPFLCGLDFLVRFEISSKPKGLFAKPPNARLLDTEDAERARKGCGLSFPRFILAVEKWSGIMHRSMI